MQKLYFEAPTSEAFLKVLQPLWGDEAFSVSLIGDNELANELAAAASQQGITIRRSDVMPTVSSKKTQLKKTRLFIITEQKGEELSKQLLSCVDLDNVIVVAPITDWHFSQKPLFLVSIPKAGTHLIYELAKALGYYEGIEVPEFPEGQTWYCVEYTNSHTVARDFFVDTVRRSPFGNRHHSFMYSPALFIYRHPLDILVSEAHYYHKDGKTAFAGWLDGIGFDERIARLLDDNWLVGSLRERIGGFLPWLDFPNVISLSFEELIGAAGGGNDIDQLRLIWSIQLKLQAPGDSSNIASHLFNPDSATFRSGQLGGYKKHLPDHIVSDFLNKNEDILTKLGYPSDGSVGLPMDRMARRKRNIRFSKADYENMPITIESDFLGCNLVRYLKRFFAIPISAGHVALEALPADVLAIIPSAPSLSEIKATLLIGNIDLSVRRHALDKLAQSIKGLVPIQAVDQYWIGVNTPHLLQEGYFGYNLIAYAGRVWAIEVTAGPLDFANADVVQDWLANGSLLRAATVDGACAAVDRLLDRRAFEAGLSKLGTTFDERLISLTSRLENGLEEAAYRNDERLNTMEARLEQRQESIAQRLSLIAPESDGGTRLLQEDYRGYNLIAYAGRVWAVEMTAGSLDFANADAVEDWLTNGSLLQAVTVDGACAAVDRLLDRRAFEAGLSKLGTTFDGRLISLTSRLENGLEEAAYRNDERLNTMETRLEQRQESIAQRLSLIAPESDGGTRLLQEDYHGYNLIAYAGRVWAVEMTAGSLDFTNAEDWLTNGSLLQAATVDGACAAVDRLLDRRAFEAGLSTMETRLEQRQESIAQRLSLIAPESNGGTRLLQEDYRGYNLIAYAGRVWAVEMTAGSFDFADADVVEDWLAHGSLLQAATVDGACAAVDRLLDRQAVEAGLSTIAQRLSLIAPESDGGTRLLQEDYRGYNLIAYAGRVWAVEMTAGSLDFADADVVEDWLAHGSLLQAATVDGACAAVDRLLDRQAVEAGLSKLGTAIDEKLTSLASRLESSLEEAARRSDERFVVLEHPRWRQWLGRKKNNGKD